MTKNIIIIHEQRQAQHQRSPHQPTTTTNLQRPRTNSVTVAPDPQFCQPCTKGQTSKSAKIDKIATRNDEEVIKL